MNAVWQLPAVVAVVSSGVVFGTDAFCALVQRPALARVDDVALAAVMGAVHRYGDARMPSFGIVGLLGALAASVLAAVGGRPAPSIAAAAATGLWLVWLVLYLRVSAPINRVLIAAADRHETPPDARALQRAWDRVIAVRAVLLGLVVLALALGLTA